jgi:hypothetical protein
MVVAVCVGWRRSPPSRWPLVLMLSVKALYSPIMFLDSLSGSAPIFFSSL